jgi:hypothetical protein
MKKIYHLLLLPIIINGSMTFTVAAVGVYSYIFTGNTVWLLGNFDRTYSLFLITVLSIFPIMFWAWAKEDGL